MNNKRKFQQLKTYSKIMKFKKSTGEVQQIKMPASQKMEEEVDAGIIQKKQKNEDKMSDQESLEQQDFQDQFSDEFEDQEAWVDDDSSSHDEQADGTNQTSMQNQMSQEKYENKNNKVKQQKEQVFIGTNKNLKKGEVLDFDNNAYDMLHRLNIQWPALSIDFVSQDSPFIASQPYQKMTQYPYEVFTVQGSCNNTKKNTIYLTKWSKLHKTKYDSDPDAMNEKQQGNDDEDAQILVQQIPTTFNVNRLRTLKNSPIVAFWNEAGEINIMDLTNNYEKLVNGIGTKKKTNNIEDHPEIKLIQLKSQSEGYAINWNPHKVGQLATGNTRNVIQIFQNNQNYTNWQKTCEYNYHKSSVQDIIFSPTEETVFASCSADGTLQIVDMRVGNFNQSQICVHAHNKDVNVCDWNKIATHLIVTGSDDCSVKVWDLRMCSKNSGKNSEQLLTFKWHTEPITSIKFQPNDESSIAVTSEDNSITFWDMSVENEQQDPQIPNQLMFIHQGQQQIKEIAFHPVFYQMTVSTALDGINIFKPSYQMPQQILEGEEDLKQMEPISQKQLDKYLAKMSLDD